jgi:hypothetical protein
MVMRTAGQASVLTISRMSCSVPMSASFLLFFFLVDETGKELVPGRGAAELFRELAHCLEGSCPGGGVGLAGFPVHEPDEFWYVMAR